MFLITDDDNPHPNSKQLLTSSKTTLIVCRSWTWFAGSSDYVDRTLPKPGCKLSPFLSPLQKSRLTQQSSIPSVLIPFHRMTRVTELKHDSLSYRPTPLARMRARKIRGCSQHLFQSRGLMTSFLRCDFTRSQSVPCLPFRLNSAKGSSSA